MAVEKRETPLPRVRERRRGAAGTIGATRTQRSAQALVAWIIVEVAIAVAILVALYLVRQALILIYVSMLLAVGLAPLVRRVEGLPFLQMGTHRPPRWVPVLAIYVGVLAALGGIAFRVIPPLVRQARDVLAALPPIVERIQHYLVARGLLAESRTFGELMQQAPPGTDTVAAAVIAFWSFFGGVLGIFSILILTFYLLLDADAPFVAFVRLFPLHHRMQVRIACARITGKVSAWLHGQLLIAATMGAAVALELGLLGVPYFFVLATIAAAGELIPYVGPILSAIPAIIASYTVSGKLALGVAALYFVNQQIESQILVPKIMERQVGLSAVAVVVALLFGSALLGIVGAILAVPTAAIAQVVFQELWPDEPPEMRPVP